MTIRKIIFCAFIIIILICTFCCGYYGVGQRAETNLSYKVLDQAMNYDILPITRYASELINQTNEKNARQMQHIDELFHDSIEEKLPHLEALSENKKMYVYRSTHSRENIDGTVTSIFDYNSKDIISKHSNGKTTKIKKGAFITIQSNAQISTGKIKIFKIINRSRPLSLIERLIGRNKKLNETEYGDVEQINNTIALQEVEQSDDQNIYQLTAEMMPGTYMYLLEEMETTVSHSCCSFAFIVEVLG